MLIDYMIITKHSTPSHPSIHELLYPHNISSPFVTISSLFLVFDNLHFTKEVPSLPVSLTPLTTSPFATFYYPQTLGHPPSLSTALPHPPFLYLHSIAPPTPQLGYQGLPDYPARPRFPEEAFRGGVRGEAQPAPSFRPCTHTRTHGNTFKG